MRNPCYTQDCPMYTDEDYDGDSSVDSEGVDWYCASCEVIQDYYASCDDDEDDDNEYEDEDDE